MERDRRPRPDRQIWRCRCDRYDVTLVPHDRQRMRFVQGIQLHFQRCSPHFGH
jgi:hypothetical protein